MAVAILLPLLGSACSAAFYARVTVGEPTGREITPLAYGTGLMWIDYESRPEYQEAHLDRWHPEVLADLGGFFDPWDVYNELGLGTIRFPGGARCHEYRWDSLDASLGACDFARRTRDYFERTKPYFYTPENFLALCETHQLEPVLQVPTLIVPDPATGEWTYIWADLDRLLPAAADYAGRWVAQTRDSPYSVRYWEIGNEEYLYRWLTGADYARIVRECSQTMRAEDPSITILATAGSSREWLETLLNEAGDAVDIVTWHEYLQPTPAAIEAPQPEVLLDDAELADLPTDEIVRAYWVAMDIHLAYARENLFAPLDQYGPKPVALTEWNLQYRSPLMYSPAGAPMKMDLLLRAVEMGVDIAHYWTVFGWNFECYKLKPPMGLHPYGALQRWLGANFMGQLRRTEVSTRSIRFRNHSTPAISAHAATSPDGWSVVVINRNPEETARIEVDVTALSRVGSPRATVYECLALAGRDVGVDDRADLSLHRMTKRAVTGAEVIQLSVPPAGTALVSGGTSNGAQG